MCCFSPVATPLGLLSRLFSLGRAPKLHVSDTRIFARADGAVQHLVYSMQVAMRGQVAMILPLPVVPGSGDSAVEFVSLAGYAGFFDDLRGGFEAMVSLAQPKSRGPALRAPRLVVHRVGSFDASYVPTRADFGRLDPRFRIDDAIWDRLPEYRDWGFAVFELREGGRVHPMAFRFPTRDPSRIFFPTVHVHDGRLPAEAQFDHELYWQGAPPAAFDAVGPVAADFIQVHRACGLVDGGARMIRRVVRGVHANRDVWIEGELGPAAAA